jgi:hypothetical protein
MPELDDQPTEEISEPVTTPDTEQHIDEEIVLLRKIVEGQTGTIDGLNRIRGHLIFYSTLLIISLVIYAVTLFIVWANRTGSF